MSTFPTWREILALEYQSPYFESLKTFLQDEYAENKTIYPPKPLIFKALKLTPFANVKVVVLGQDPYHGPGQAMGLSFSVPEGMRLPPSLQNIFKELAADLQVTRPTSGDLTRWAAEGVLLLNTVLTVRAHEAHSHQGKGWEIFTDHLIMALNEWREKLVFVLWGRPAQQKLHLIDTEKHLVLTAAHPSPLAAHKGFFGCRHFSKINEFLLKNGQTPIRWVQEQVVTNC